MPRAGSHELVWVFGMNLNGSQLCLQALFKSLPLDKAGLALLELDQAHELKKGTTILPCRSHTTQKRVPLKLGAGGDFDLQECYGTGVFF